MPVATPAEHSRRETEQKDDNGGGGEPERQGALRHSGIVPRGECGVRLARVDADVGGMWSVAQTAEENLRYFRRPALAPWALRRCRVQQKWWTLGGRDGSIRRSGHVRHL